jgi:hypothetical protein
MELHESKGRDSVESEKRWRGDCVVPDYGSFSERASKAGRWRRGDGIERNDACLKFQEKFIGSDVKSFGEF